MNACWKFRAMTRGEINVDPIESEFFSTEALGSMSDALVREAVQNSLDAGLPGGQVRITITFSGSDQSLPRTGGTTYLKDLGPHLEARNAGIPELPDVTRAMGYIALEDFGTRGLAGDVREDEDPEDSGGDTKNDFFYFWRNIGRAVEGTTARGRWGLGKTVFQAASRINTYFGLTIRRDDPRRLLMGQSVLKIHRVDGKKYAPYGYFGRFEGNFALPLDDTGLVARFCHDFSLTRKDEPGLSVVIPYPEPDILPADVIRSAIHHYFFPILAGDLCITIREGEKETRLDGNTIFRFVASTDWPDKDAVTRRLQLANWCLDLPEQDLVHLKEPPPGRAPKWEEGLLEPEDIHALRRCFDRGHRIALKVPLWIQQPEREMAHTFFKVFLERDPEAERGEDHFIREGVTIAGVSSVRQRGIRVIVTAYDPPLSRFLGNAENPAHTEWQERSPNFRGRYERGASCLRFVKNSPREILRLLTTPAKGRDRGLLKDLFYLDLSPSEEPGDNRDAPLAEPGTGSPETFSPQVSQGNPFFRLQKATGGFSIACRPDSQRLPRVISVEIAYDVRRGNPFKKYRPFDFELNTPPIRVRGKGARVALAKSNKLQVVLENRAFELMVTGFDPHRDLRIRIRTSLDRKS